MFKTTKQPSLDERIVAAFSAGTASVTVAELITEAEAAVTTADETARSARERALDPALSAAELAAARREMEDAAFRRDRMRAAVTKLTERLVVLRAQERNQRRWVAYERAKAERDRLAVELKETYPGVAASLADLAARIDANDRELATINARALPEGAAHLAGAEARARGLRSFTEGVNEVPRITRRLRLPAFEYDPFSAYAWPRPGTS